MSDWATIETGVVELLAGLTVGGERLLATVAARTARDRKVLAAAVQRERLPAAYVVLTGRDPAVRDGGVAGGELMSVWIAQRSLRAESEARVGGPDVGGGWAIAEAVAGALRSAVVAGAWRLRLVDEQPAGGEEGTLVWEQRYEVDRPAELTVPTFGGVALAGSASRLQVEVGELGRSSSVFSFPGVDGVFERFGGVGERPIVWRGSLRAADDAALNAIEANIEAEIRGGQVTAMADSWGRVFESCVVQSLRRRGPRLRDGLSGEAVQEVEIELLQLMG